MELFGCTRCKQDLPSSAFSPSQLLLKGRWCRACQNESRREKRSGNAPKRLYDNCQFCGKDIRHKRAHAAWCSHSCARKGYHANNPGAQRGYMIKTTYGITVDEFNAILDRQGGKCALCRIKEIGFGKAKGQWNVDHCHATGRVRGVLCSPCNIALGLLKDSPDMLRRAIEYLES